MKYLLTMLILFTSCTDAAWDKFSALGNRSEVKCYSGERLIFHAYSTGRIANEEGSDGYFARWNIISVDGQWKHIDTTQPLSAGVSGNCVMIYTND
jgi:hypothetical protein